MNILVMIFLVLWAVVLLRSVFRGFMRTVISIILLILFIVFVRAAAPGLTEFAGNNEAVSRWAVSISRDIIEKQIEDAADSEIPDIIVDTVVDPAAREMAQPIIKVIGVLAAAVAGLIAVWIIGAVIRRLAGHREYRGVDHVLGLIPGFIKAVLYSWALLAVLEIIIGIGAGDGIAAMIADSAFLTAIRETNPFI